MAPHGVMWQRFFTWIIMCELMHVNVTKTFHMTFHMNNHMWINAHEYDKKISHDFSHE
jgi:hypothetical protein